MSGIILTAEREVLMSGEDIQQVSLETLGNGAAIEVFNRELQQVLNNVDDINTPAKTVRKVILEVSFKPNEDRTISDMNIKCSSKLAPTNEHASTVYLGKKGRNTVAYERNPLQGELGLKENGSGSVHSMAGKGMA